MQGYKECLTTWMKRSVKQSQSLAGMVSNLLA